MDRFMLYTRRTLMDLKNDDKKNFIIRRLKFFLLFFICASGNSWSFLQGNMNIKVFIANFIITLFIIEGLVIISSSFEFNILKKVYLDASKETLLYDISLILLKILIIANFRIIIIPTIKFYDINRTIPFVLSITLVLIYSKWNFINKYIKK